MKRRKRRKKKRHRGNSRALPQQYLKFRTNFLSTIMMGLTRTGYVALDFVLTRHMSSQNRQLSAERKKSIMMEEERERVNREVKEEQEVSSVFSWRGRLTWWRLENSVFLCPNLAKWMTYQFWLTARTCNQTRVPRDEGIGS